MFSKHSCAGISLQTHILYLIVFLTRYVNSEFFDPPIYNIIFKIFYISSTLLTIVLMLTKFNKTYNKKHDSFRIIWILLICVLATALSTREYSLIEITWTFSLWTEAFAILPQLFLLQRTQRVDVMTHKYIFFLGLYRLFYIINWIYKTINAGRNRTPYVMWITGIIQTLLYADFIYYYIKAIIYGKEFELPR
ncbi:ER lumen protein retaining receptor, putative [Trichomonas vaginalis G3]|uniref:ER lumen protein retaining receptor, putative n=1 Tax=Trichomonas vaginalis (strain ATCC PRA-98 / G3) TaxID=412133 RepID=A2F849_TRIV3|nr:ER retention sequence binding [Trichomonas vaginalis G3]EAX98925.1 ER lumen protein retaining receptor, putative [Trichomonas vaginalis G3]KAI5526698.1 ER retention sequence binding [Trichomonas vaginalis G3]|eukprot:XP_001311855.1 ER lumen protein retaining receptor [Trichomonas vaginalis G3]